MRKVFMTVALLTALGGLVWAAEIHTTVRVLHVRHASVLEASTAVLPLLSENGSLTVQPHQKRITVQDRPEVVARASDVIARLDRSPESYRITVELLEGTSTALPSVQRATVDERLRRMFRFADYRRLGATVFEGEMGSPAAATLGTAHRLSFLAESLGVADETAWGIPDPGTRLHLQWLRLERLVVSDGGVQRSFEVLRTSVFLSENQEVFIGAGGSEGSTSGLVLILHAQRIGGS